MPPWIWYFKLNRQAALQCGAPGWTGWRSPDSGAGIVKGRNDDRTGRRFLNLHLRSGPARRLHWFSLATTFREERFFLTLAVFIGLFSGLAVVCFRLSIEWVKIALLGAVPEPHSWRLLVAPVGASLVVSVLVAHRLSPSARQRRQPDQSRALHLQRLHSVPHRGWKVHHCGPGHRRRPLPRPGRPIACKSAPASPPLSAAAWTFPAKSCGLLAPVGAAAGLAAAFNAPISAVLFVIEEVIGRWSAGVLGSVVLSAISSVVVVRWFLGSEALFRIPAVTMANPSELLAYVVLGLTGGLASVAFAKMIGYLRPLPARPTALDTIFSARRSPAC